MQWPTLGHAKIKNLELSSSPKWVVVAQTLGLSSVAVSGMLAGNWIGSVAAGTGMGGGIASVDLNGCIIKSSSYLLICNFETCCIVFKINSWGWCSGIAS